MGKEAEASIKREIAIYAVAILTALAILNGWPVFALVSLAGMMFLYLKHRACEERRTDTTPEAMEDE